VHALRPLALALLAATVLAGCSGPSPDRSPPAGPQEEPAAVHAPVFGCGEGQPGPTPCFTDWTPNAPAFGGPYGLAPSRWDPDRIAIVTHSYVPASPDAPSAELSPFGRPAVAVSADGGATWQEHLVGGTELDPLRLGLREGSAAWTPDGVLAFAGYLEQDVYAESGSVGTVGSLWVGRSLDGGRTWEQAFLHPDGGIGASLTALSAGELVVAWPGDRGRIMAVRSADSGATWSEPLVGPTCFFPSRAVEWNGTLLVGCEDPYDWQEIADLRVVRIDFGKSSIEEAGILPGSGACTPFGPVGAGPRLLALRVCGTEVSLFRSVDDGATWTRWGEMPAGGNGTPGLKATAAEAFAAGPNGTVLALVGYGSDGGLPVSYCTCRSDVYLFAWRSDGSLAVDAVAGAFDMADPVTLAPAMAFSPENDLASSPWRTWILVYHADGRIGWAQSEPVAAAQ